MKKVLSSVLLTVLLSGCLFGCSRNVVSEDPAPVPSVEPTPTPVPVLSFPDGSNHQLDETRLDLHRLTHKDVPETAELLQQMPQLKYVTSERTAPGQKQNARN